MKMMQIHRISSCARRGALGLLLALIYWLTWPGVSQAQLDICGCIGAPGNLGDFDSSNQATWPSGTTFDNSRTITIPLPPDGTLVFSSFTVGNSPLGPGFCDAAVRFVHPPDPANANRVANTPVTLLVTGNVNINPPVFCGGANLIVDGSPGTNGSSGVNGVGGMGGPGGFSGGDGAYQLVNFASNGGSGLGPGGGLGGTAAPLTDGSGGTFVGVAELLPLVGGAGGGGGASTSNALNCSGAGGGGGGGALVIAANGTITVNGTISANGANGSSPADFSCSSGSGGGSAGAIRLLANTIAGTGSLLASGGLSYSTQCGFCTPAGSGAIRLEAFTNTMSATNTQPVATRAPAPGPVTNPLTTILDITTINGQSVPVPPQGFRGAIDVLLSAPGTVTIGLQTIGVPSGTAINVTAKPKVGGALLSLSPSPILDPTNCDTAGTCFTTATFNLPSGAFFIEAQATFAVP